MRRALVALSLLSCAAWLPSCRSCCTGDDRQVVGRVVSLEPVTELTPDESGWRDATPEESLHLGDTLRTDDSGRATLELTGSRQLQVSPQSLVRFTELRETPGEANPELHLLVQSGSLDVSAAEGEGAPMVVLSGPGGRLRLSRGSGARLTVDQEQGQMRIEVMVGLAELERGGEIREIPAGETLVVTVGLAELERPEPPRADPIPEAGPTSPDAGGLLPASQPDAEGETVLVGDRSLSVLPVRDVFPILQGGSAVIHDPQRTGGFTVRFPAIEGCERYLIVVDHNGARLLEAVSTRPGFALDGLSYGAYRWSATCLGGEGAEVTDDHQGRVSRASDQSGNVTLPTTVPSNSLDSGGRQYTVTYQNRLPAITLRWSGAPEAGGYRLDVFDNASGRRLHSGQGARPAQSFRSGFFQEGSYYWIFRAEGAGANAASPLTRMRIVFDNQMPSIQILEPREGASASGSVRVRGLVSVGSTVTVNGVPLDLGGDFRFDQTVPVGPGNLLVFRVTTLRRGSALYLRHLGR
jgi:hypothetical protein